MFRQPAIPSTRRPLTKMQAVNLTCDRLACNPIPPPLTHAEGGRVFPNLLTLHKSWLACSYGASVGWLGAPRTALVRDLSLPFSP
jgi:hypothetical protein